MGIYNCAPTLKEAIDSILAQTYTNWELILCDDCSTDDTYKIAEEYRQKYPDKIILLKNEKNSRLAFTLNRCLEAATGEFVARMDGDDISVNTRFEKQISFLDEHPQYDMCGTSMRQFQNTQNGMIFGKTICCPQTPDKYTQHKTIPFNHATILAKRKVFDVLGGYTVANRTIRGQDVDLWYRFFKNDLKGYNIEEPLYFVREEEEAIKRRTFNDRYMSFKTDMFGYGLLEYPKYWYYKPFINLLKGLVPLKVLMLKNRNSFKKNKKP